MNTKVEMAFFTLEVSLNEAIKHKDVRMINKIIDCSKQFLETNKNANSEAQLKIKERVSALEKQAVEALYATP